jgi:hypothetical protein
VPTTAEHLADLRRLEQYAIAGGADDKLLARVIPLHVLLLTGVRPDAACAFLRAQQLIERDGLSVKQACSRAGLSRSRYYELCGISGHNPWDARSNSSSVGGPMPRIVKNANSTLSASDVAPVPVSGNGKPSWTPPAVPRANAGLSTGASGGNFDAGSMALPNSTPPDLLDKEGTGSV